MNEGEKSVSYDLSILLHDLIESYKQMLGIVKDISDVTNKTKLLSFNSAIEAARAGEAGRGFTVIAKEIQNMAVKSEKANNRSYTIINEMHKSINDVIGVRTADIAFDLIDKIDRNLFERNCDVQAWATFDIIVEYLETKSEGKQKEVVKLLHNLYEIYEVYYDIFMADAEGKVVAAAVNQEVIGRDVSQTRWFRGVMDSCSNTVSDMYYSKDTNGHTVAYSCPIRDKNNQIIGVLSTRFNWNYIYDIINKAKVSANGDIYVINKEGLVIASRNEQDVLNKNISDVPAVNCVINGEDYGYMIEEDGQGNLQYILGYAHTRGYNAYKGKDWSVVVKEPF